MKRLVNLGARLSDMRLQTRAVLLVAVGGLAACVVVASALATVSVSISGGGQIVNDPYNVSFGGAYYPDGSCDWQVNFHNVSNTDVAKGKFHSDVCQQLTTFASNPGTTVVRFVALGTFNGVPGYSVCFRMEDAGEPGSSDTIRIQLFHGTNACPSPGGIYDTSGSGDFPNESNNVGTARTDLDNGNLQISTVTAP